MSTWDHINVHARMNIGGARAQLKRRLIAFCDGINSFRALRSETEAYRLATYTPRIVHCLTT